MSEGHSYDIHEKIAQLETELLQHELLIRRQKHVITSLKNMINNPNAGGVASPSASTAHAFTAAPVPVIARSVPATTATSSSSAPAQSAAVITSAAPGAKQSSTSSSAKKATAPKVTVPDRPFNHEKKRTAMNKVKQFCKTIPRFGALVVKHKRTSSASESGTEGANKRQRIDNTNTNIQIGSPVGSPAVRSVANRAVVSAGSTAPGVPRNGASISSHSVDDDALFDAAGAKLRYLKNTTSSGASSSMQPVGLMPVASTVAAWETSQVGAKPTAKRTSTSSVASAVSSSSSNAGSSASAGAGASSSSNRVASVGSKITTTVPAPAVESKTEAQKKTEATRLRALAMRTAPRSSSSVSDAISTESSHHVGTPPPKFAPRTSASPTAATTTTAGRTTSSSSAASSSATAAAAPSSSIGTPKSITTNKNLLTGSAHKNLDIFDHCKCVRTLEEKLEIAKDMHAYIICNPRRLQQFLDSTGGRDLFLSWLISAMNAVGAAPAGGPLEVQLTKLIEYTVLLINQAYWDARTVSELRFDKTLKNLYRQFEGKKEAHHVTVSNIVKGIWPSYRIMRKQHEGKTMASAVLIAD